MNNLNTSFESFVNEGIIPKSVKRWASKTFKPGEMGDIIDEIFKDIKYNFDINNLSFITAATDSRTSVNYFAYKTSLGDTIKVSDDERFIINDDDVRDFVNKEKIRDIYIFLRTKYVNRDRESYKSERKNKLSDIRNKYSKYIDLHEEDDDYGGEC
jgi:hypothetical protein